MEKFHHLKKMTTTKGFFQEMSTFFRKMATSNEVRDSMMFKRHQISMTMTTSHDR